MSNLINHVIKRTMSSGSVINHVTIIGAGLMGSGIAQVAATSGHRVTMVELDEKLLDKARKGIEKSLERVGKKQFKDEESKITGFVKESMDRISGSTDLSTVVKDTDIVIEAIVENLEVKQKLFSSIDSVAKPSTIFASNTSSIPINEIAKGTQRLDRFCGLHFFNPVPVMKLLEVVRTPETSNATYTTAMDFGKKLGKTCITCKDTPGFVVNRLLVPYMAEAVRMLERGDATARDIDIAMKLGAGYPMGPFELSDYVGIDTTQKIMGIWHKIYPDNPLFEPIPMLNKLVEEGKFGMKSGEGFYSYKK
ncbi:hypothetical protein ACKWTF_004942 [Chironomus riparius]